MLRFAAFILSGALAAGCGTVRSAIVPLALDPPIAQPRGRAEVHLRETTLTGVQASAAPASAALYLPRVQLDGGGSVRLGRHFALRFHAGSAIDAGAIQAGASSARPPGRAGWYVGASPTLLFPLDHGRTQLALGVDVTGAIVPYVWEESFDCGTFEEPRTCGSTSDQTWFALMVGTSFSAARWVADVVRIGGSLGVRMQPTLDSAFAADARAPTSFGYVAVAMQAEVRFQLVPELALAVESQWVAPIGPYVVYPTVGVTVYGTFGEGEGEDPLDPDTWIDAEL